MAIEPWFATKVSFPNHPKVDDLMQELGFNRNETLGLLTRIMCWVRMNAVYGIMGPRNLAEKLAKECDWKGEPAKLLDSLIKTGWIDTRPDNSFFFHDWDDHNFALIKGEEQKDRNREKTRERQRRYKARERQAQLNRYKAHGSPPYQAEESDALSNGLVTRYPTVGEKNMEEKKPSKNLSKSTLFDADALPTRDLTGEVTRDSLLDPNIKHPHSRVIQFYLDCYKVARGEDYIGPRDRMARNIKDLKRDFEEEEIARRIKNYFESTDPYYVDKVKFDWATFYSQFNRLAEPVHVKNTSQQRSKDNGFDKPKGTEQTIDDFQ